MAHARITVRASSLLKRVQTVYFVVSQGVFLECNASLLVKSAPAKNFARLSFESFARAVLRKYLLFRQLL